MEWVQYNNKDQWFWDIYKIQYYSSIPGHYIKNDCYIPYYGIPKRNKIRGKYIQFGWHVTPNTFWYQTLEEAQKACLQHKGENRNEKK